MLRTDALAMMLYICNKPLFLRSQQIYTYSLPSLPEQVLPFAAERVPSLPAGLLCSAVQRGTALRRQGYDALGAGPLACGGLRQRRL